MIGWQRRGHVCAAVFDPPQAGEQARRWRDEHAEEYGPLDDWIMSLGRAAAGGDWASSGRSRRPAHRSGSAAGMRDAHTPVATTGADWLGRRRGATAARRCRWSA